MVSAQGDQTQTELEVRPAEPAQRAAWLAMRRELWPEGSEAEHAAEIDAFFDGNARAPLAVLLAVSDSDEPLGFAELSIRWCAEGCKTDRVAYLEGWYVVPEARKSGVGKALVAAAEDWARYQGCSEFASDAEVGNEVSALAHAALGFEDVGLVRCFRKPIQPV